MIFIPLIVNAIVICVMSAELFSVSSGMASADQLLVVSTLSGLLTFLSFKLSKEALLPVTSVTDSLDSLEEPV